MKLDTPEGQAFVKLWNDYDPQVGYDLHTSDGSSHGYYLTYSPPLNPDTSDAIMKIMKDEWFPFVTKTDEGEARLGHVLLRQRAREARRGGRARPRRAGDAAAGRGAARHDAAATPADPAAAGGAGRPARLGHVRARPALPQQLRRPAQSLRAAERGLRLRDVRRSHQGDELLHGRGAELRAPERRQAQEGACRRRQGSDRRQGARHARADQDGRHDRDPDGRGRRREAIRSTARS